MYLTYIFLLGILTTPNGQPLGSPQKQLSSAEELQMLKGLIKDMDSALIQRDVWKDADIIEGASGGLITHGILLMQDHEQLIQPRAKVIVLFYRS